MVVVVVRSFDCAIGARRERRGVSFLVDEGKSEAPSSPSSSSIAPTQAPPTNTSTTTTTTTSFSLSARQHRHAHTRSTARAHQSTPTTVVEPPLTPARARILSNPGQRCPAASSGCAQYSRGEAPRGHPADRRADPQLPPPLPGRARASASALSLVAPPAPRGKQQQQQQRQQQQQHPSPP